MRVFTSGIVGDNPKYYLVSCSAYKEKEDMTAFRMSKAYHSLDEISYIDTYEIEYCKIDFTEDMNFNIEWCDAKTPFAYKCRVYEIKNIKEPLFQSILEVETRPCSECLHFKSMIGTLPICKKKLMSVLNDLHVSYKIEEGTCFEEIHNISILRNNKVEENKVKEYVLLDSSNGGGFYRGKMYVYQGCKYPCYTSVKEEAKVYKSEKVAKNVAESLSDKGWPEFETVELK